MAAARIEIYRKNYSIVSGRRVEEEPTLHHKAWCEIGNLYGSELYGALDIRLENTIIFRVRYCKAIKAMQQHLKDYYIKFEGEVYDIFASDFRRNERQYVQLKANRRD